MENNDQTNPLFRRTRLPQELEKIRKWKEEGKSIDEIFDLIDKRVANRQDIEEIFSNEEQKENVEVFEETKENEEKKEIENVEVEDSEDNEFSEEELDEIISDEGNYYNEDNVLNAESEETTEEVVEEETIENISEETKENEVKEFKENQEQEEFRYLKDEELEDFPDQPFKLYGEEEKEEMVQSIRINGIIQPIVVRPLDNGKFQILAGHNRRYCGREAGLKEFPCKIKYGLTDDEAKLYLIDTNIATRKKISPMEIAKALQIKKNTYKSEQIRLKIQKAVLDENLEDVNVREKVQEVENMSRGSLQRYLRLNHLEESLQNLVDDEKIPLKVAENISFMGRPAQKIIANMLEKDKKLKISETQSKKLKKEEFLNKDKISEILQRKEVSKDEEEITIKFKKIEIESFFKDLEPEIVKEKILDMLQNFTQN